MLPKPETLGSGSGARGFVLEPWGPYTAMHHFNSPKSIKHVNIDKQTDMYIKCIYTCKKTCKETCTYTGIYSCISYASCVYIYIYKCMSVCLYACMYVCTYVYVSVHPQTASNTLTSSKAPSRELQGSGLGLRRVRERHLRGGRASAAWPFQALGLNPPPPVYPARHDMIQGKLW